MGSSFNTFGLVVNARKMKKILLEYVVNPPAEVARLWQSDSARPLLPFQGKKTDELDIRDGIIFEKAHPENTSCRSESYLLAAAWTGSRCRRRIFLCRR